VQDIIQQYYRLEFTLAQYADRLGIEVEKVPENIGCFSKEDAAKILEIFKEQIKLVQHLRLHELESVVTGKVVNLNDYKELRH
jgi:hypothetical protein